MKEKREGERKEGKRGERGKGIKRRRGKRIQQLGVHISFILTRILR